MKIIMVIQLIVNTVWEIPNLMARYLSNSQEYVDHSFRRSSATMLANAG